MGHNVVGFLGSGGRSIFSLWILLDFIVREGKVRLRLDHNARE